MSKKSLWIALLTWLRGPKCPCGHRAARHHPSCSECRCSRWGETWGYVGGIVRALPPCSCGVDRDAAIAGTAAHAAWCTYVPRLPESSKG